MNSKNILLWVLGGAVLLALIGGIFFFVFRSNTPATNNQNTGSLNVGGTQTTGVGSLNTSTDTTNQVVPVTGSTNKQTVFKISDGPVTGATFIQTLFPTTTYARYVLQENGHVMDQAIDVPGSLPRSASNTTIPGTQRAMWASKGGSLYLQYLDTGVVKTVLLSFPEATSSKSVLPVRIQFLQNDLIDFAISPDGKQLAYLTKTSTGSDGFVSNLDGSNSKKIFSMRFSQFLLTWPSQNTLLLTTKSSVSAAGVVFSVNTQTGGVVPLIYGNSLTATADRLFANIIYQAVALDSNTRSSYTHNVKQGNDVSLSFDPIPEKCTWSNLATSTLYCAAPLQFVDANYLDQWHAGVASVQDSIVSFVPSQNSATDVIAIPGSADGGVASDILEMAVSPDEKYLLFVKKGDRSLWGVRLGQN